MNGSHDPELNRLLSDDVLSVQDKEDVLAGVLAQTAAQPQPRWWSVRNLALLGAGGTLAAAASLLFIVSTRDLPEDNTFTPRGGTTDLVDVVCGQARAQVTPQSKDTCLACAAGPVQIRLTGQTPETYAYASLAEPRGDWYVLRDASAPLSSSGTAFAINEVGPHDPHTAPLSLNLRVVFSPDAWDGAQVRQTLDPAGPLPTGARVANLALRPDGQCP